MKYYKLISLFFFLFIGKNLIFSDQLSYITKSQGDSAVRVLNNQSEVLLWCACCESDPKIIVKVLKVYSEYTGNKDFYHIFLIGIDPNGKKVKEELDLAYVHINNNGKWYCLGRELGFKCKPCTKPFKHK